MSLPSPSLLLPQWRQPAVCCSCNGTVLKPHAVLFSLFLCFFPDESRKLEVAEKAIAWMLTAMPNLTDMLQHQPVFAFPMMIHSAYSSSSSSSSFFFLLPPLLLLASVLCQHATSSSLQAMSWTLQRRPQLASGWPASTLLSCSSPQQALGT